MFAMLGVTSVLILSMKKCAMFMSKGKQESIKGIQLLNNEIIMTLSEKEYN